MNGDGTTAKVTVGKNQHLLFRETDKPLPDYDEHHVQIYVVNFSGPHQRLGERGLVNREDNQYQYRFRDIVDLDTGKHLFTIEHEVRSLTHPMCLRPWSTAIRRRPRATTPTVTTRTPGRWSRNITTISSNAARRRCRSNKRAISPASLTWASQRAGRSCLGFTVRIR